MRNDTVKRVGIRLLLPLVIVTTWWVTSAGSTSPFYPPLAEILESFRDTWIFNRVGTDVIPSLRRLLVALVLATVIGVAAGMALGRSRRLAQAFNPAIQFGRSVPGTALVPISVLLFGIGDGAKTVVIGFVCVFPILLNTIDAVRGVDPQLEDVARTFRLSRAQRLIHILLPASAPQIMAGVRTALGIGFIMMVITELYAAANGIGFVTMSARNAFDVPQMWAGTVLLGLLGVTLSTLFVLAERHILRWHTRMTEKDQ
jgi:ABC-type nitrate/sulfonate/bicarbonate transport system permease component